MTFSFCTEASAGRKFFESWFMENSIVRNVWSVKRLPLHRSVSTDLPWPFDLEVSKGNWVTMMLSLFSHLHDACICFLEIQMKST